MPPFPAVLDSPLFVSVFSSMLACFLCLLYNQAGRIIMGIAFAYSYVQRPVDLMILDFVYLWCGCLFVIPLLDLLDGR